MTVEERCYMVAARRIKARHARIVRHVEHDGHVRRVDRIIGVVRRAIFIVQYHAKIIVADRKSDRIAV